MPTNTDTSTNTEIHLDKGIPGDLRIVSQHPCTEQTGPFDTHRDLTALWSRQPNCTRCPQSLFWCVVIVLWWPVLKWGKNLYEESSTLSLTISLYDISCVVMFLAVRQATPVLSACKQKNKTRACVGHYFSDLDQTSAAVRTITFYCGAAPNTY